MYIKTSTPILGELQKTFLWYLRGSLQQETIKSRNYKITKFAVFVKGGAESDGGEMG